MKFKKLFKNKKPLIGMIHLPPLPGYPLHPGMDKVIEKALKDLKTLEKAGFDGALVENDNDQPHQIGVNSAIKDAFKEVMIRIVKEAKIPVGMEIIYDMLATLDVASQAGANFIRLDVFVDNVETKWGKIFAQEKEIVDLRHKLGMGELVLLTDIQVKHAKLLDKKSLAQSAKEAVENNSDGLIITGNWTGEEPLIQDCKVAKDISNKIPVLVGSGLNINNVEKFLKIADGAIVGTSIKIGDYIDYNKAKALVVITRNLYRS